MYIKTCENIKKVATTQAGGFTTSFLPDHSYLKENYKLIGIYLNKQQVPDANRKATQHIIFMRNLERAGNAAMLFILKEVKESILDFSQGTVRILSIYFNDSRILV